VVRWVDENESVSAANVDFSAQNYSSLCHSMNVDQSNLTFKIKKIHSHKDTILLS